MCNIGSQPHRTLGAGRNAHTTLRHAWNHHGQSWQWPLVEARARARTKYDPIHDGGGLLAPELGVNQPVSHHHQSPRPGQAKRASWPAASVQVASSHSSVAPPTFRMVGGGTISQAHHFPLSPCRFLCGLFRVKACIPVGCLHGHVGGPFDS